MQMAVQQQMQNLMASAYPGSYAQPGQYAVGDLSALQRGQLHDKQLASPADRQELHLVDLLSPQEPAKLPLVSQSCSF